MGLFLLYVTKLNFDLKPMRSYSHCRYKFDTKSIRQRPKNMIIWYWQKIMS